MTDDTPDREEWVRREKYHEALDQRNEWKNKWHNLSERLRYYEENTVPIEDLRELVERWNTREYHLGEAQPDKRAELEKCRRELEEVLDE